MFVCVCVCEGRIRLQQGMQTKGKESEKEIQPQLFPLGLVAMATKAFSAERGTNIRKSERYTHRERERDGGIEILSLSAHIR